MYRITNRRFASASECDDSITEFESYADACRAFNSQVELILTFIAGIDGHVEPIEGQTQFAYFSDSKRAARVFVDYELEYLTYSTVTMGVSSEHSSTRSTIISLNRVS